MTTSKLLYTNFYPELSPQKMFCKEHLHNHTGNLPILDSYANPVIMRLIAKTVE